MNNFKNIFLIIFMVFISSCSSPPKNTYKPYKPTLSIPYNHTNGGKGNHNALLLPYNYTNGSKGNHNALLLPYNHTNGSKGNHNRLLRDKYVQKNLTTDRIIQCTSIMREVNSAVAAEDYNNVILSSELYISKCHNLIPIEFAQRVAFLSLAYFSLGKFEKSLDVANMCIKYISYREPNCHKWKSLSLLSLGRLTEGVKELNITEKLTIFEIKNQKNNLKSEENNMKYVTVNIIRRKHLSNINLYKATIESYKRLLIIINNTRTNIH